MRRFPFSTVSGSSLGSANSMNRSAQPRTFSCPMNKSQPKPAPPGGPEPEPSFDAEFQAAIDAWRKQHRLREDDAVFLCLELFLIHQGHWHQLRRKELPSSQDIRH